MIVMKLLGDLFTILLVLTVFNLMIIVHELGHMLAARWRGLVVDEFGIWFGKPLWRKKINGVWYSLGSLPFGGFVKLPQMAPMESIEGKTETAAEDLPPITALSKIIVAFAGPLFSFGLALVFAVLVWAAGRPVRESEATTTIGYVGKDTPASNAKPPLKAGDRITAIDGHPVTHWSGMGRDSIQFSIIASEGDTLNLQVERPTADGKTEHLSVTATPKTPDTKFWERKALKQLSVMAEESPVIGDIPKDGPAVDAGLKPGDIIREINGERIYHWVAIREYIGNHSGQPLVFTVERGKETVKSGPIQVKSPVVEFVQPNSPAERAGFKLKDRVASFNGEAILSAQKFTELVHGYGEKVAEIGVIRDDKPITIKVQPELVDNGSSAEKLTGIGLQPDDDFGVEIDPAGINSQLYQNPVDQVKKAGSSIFDTIAVISSRKSGVGVQQLGGPVMMMRAYWTFFHIKGGWRFALWFSVVLNVNLAMLNLLPIPVLDGGHIVLAIIEAIRRRPVNVRILEGITTACAIVIIGFMVFIFFFDVQDWVKSDRDGGLKFKRSTPASQK